MINKYTYLKELDCKMKSIQVKQRNRIVQNPIEIEKFVRENDPRKRLWKVIPNKRRLFLYRGTYNEEQYWLYSKGYVVVLYDDFILKVVSLTEMEYHTLFTEIKPVSKLSTKENKEEDRINIRRPNIPNDEKIELDYDTIIEEQQKKIDESTIIIQAAKMLKKHSK